MVSSFYRLKALNPLHITITKIKQYNHFLIVVCIIFHGLLDRQKMILNDKIFYIAQKKFLYFSLTIITVLVFHYKIIIGAAHFPFDYEGYHYPLLHFISSEINNGRFPFYDPFIYSGIPLYLNTQASLFYPVHIIFFFIIMIFEIELSQYLFNFLGIFHFILGSVFFYFLSRHYKISPKLSAIGAALYTLNGHIVAQSQHLGMIETFSWLPLIFLLFSKFFRKPNLKIAVWIAIIVSNVILIGFLPQVVAMLLVVCAFSTTYLFINRESIRKKLACLLISAVITICLTAVVTLPLLTADQSMETLAIQGPLPLNFCKTLFWPNIFNTFNWPNINGHSDPTVSYMFSGTVIPALILIGFFVFLKKIPEVIMPFVFSSFFVFFPVVDFFDLKSFSPMVTLIRPVNFLYFVMHFGILLSLFSLENLSNKRYILIIIISLTTAISTILVATNNFSTIDVRSALTIGTTTILVIILLKYHPTYVGIIGFILVTQLFFVNVNRKIWTYPIQPKAVSLQSINFKKGELLSILRKPSEPHRIAIDSRFMGYHPWNGGWRIWKIETIGGFEPSRSQKYFNIVTRELSDWHTNRLFNIANFDSTLLNILNVKYYVSTNMHPPKNLPPQWHCIYNYKYCIYENKNFHPRYAIVPLESIDINIITGQVFYSPCTEKTGQVDIVTRKPGYIQLAVCANHQKAFLFISERDYRGWNIFINENEIKPLTVNNLVMGVPISEGHHTVVLKFKMPNLNLIISITILGIFIIFSVFTISRLYFRNRAHCCK